MINNSSGRRAWMRKAVLGLAAVSLLALAVVAPAMAGQPKGDFAVFTQCPVKNPEVNLCIYAESTGGSFQIGQTKVPINKVIKLQGGSILNEETGQEKFVGASNGATLSKTPLTVPGGLLGIIAPEGWPEWLQELFNKFINEGITGVTATAELVNNPTISRTNLLFQEGVALGLPVRIKLSNVFLGEECYIGSQESPVMFELTTGKTEPPPPNQEIKGAVGELEFKDEFQLVIIKNNKLVDNAFSAPGAKGCGGIFSFLVDPAVNAKLGLPSAAGHNTAILEGTLQNATAEAVIESGK